MAKEEDRKIEKLIKWAAAEFEEFEQAYHGEIRVRTEGPVPYDMLFSYSHSESKSGREQDWALYIRGEGIIGFQYNMKSSTHIKSEEFKLPEACLQRLRKAFSPYREKLADFVVNTGKAMGDEWLDTFWFIGYRVGGWCLKNRKPEDFVRREGMSEEDYQDRQQDRIMIEMFHKACKILHAYGFDITWDGYTVRGKAKRRGDVITQKEMDCLLSGEKYEPEKDWDKGLEQYRPLLGMLGMERVKVEGPVSKDKVVGYFKSDCEGYEDDAWEFDVYENGTLIYQHDRRKDGKLREDAFHLPHEAMERLEQAFKPYSNQFPEFVMHTGLLGLDGWSNMFYFLGYCFVSWVIEERKPEDFVRKEHWDDEYYQDRQQERIMIEMFNKGCDILRDYGFDISLAGFRRMQKG